LLAVRKIAKQLSISLKRIQILGLKDKKALTSQHISIENIRWEKLEHTKIRGLRILPLRYSENMFFPTMHFGNMFNLMIRRVELGNSIIERRTHQTIRDLRNFGGAPNYYGHQRFGTIRPITHLIGNALARNDLKEAIQIFLAKPSPHEHPDSRNARQKLLETGNFTEALNFFPQTLLYERLVLSHLAKNPEDNIGAFRKLPKQLNRLFLQAYQSYLFNRFLSQRIKRKLPLNQPHVGDYTVRISRYGLPTRTHTLANQKNLTELQKGVKAGKKCVALPMIGFKQFPSEGIQGEIEKSILEDEDIGPTNFHIPSLPEVSSPGGLRPTLAKILGFHVGKPTKDDLYPNKSKIKLSFTLNRGCYATIVLREFMKTRNPSKAGF
jgi:tRNA pseudouridine13 synthase